MNKVKIGIIQQNCEYDLNSNKYKLKLEIEKLGKQRQVVDQDT